jgi:conserved phage protein
MKDNKWITLKDELTQKYIELHGKSNKISNDLPTVEIANILVGKRVVKQHLQRMDELDGTHEFKNLLSDLERGSDES